MCARPVEKIVLFVEASERALDAARYAIALSKANNAALHAVYVVNEKMLEQLLRAKVFVKDEEVDLERDLEEDGKRYLAVVEKLAREKGSVITTELLRGVVHRQVIDKATQMEASLIIIGELEEPISRRDSFYDESEMIVRYSSIPVLVVKGSRLAGHLYDSA